MNLDNDGYTITFHLHKSVTVFFNVGKYSGKEPINIKWLENIIKQRFRSNIEYKKKSVARSKRRTALRKYNESRRTI